MLAYLSTLVALPSHLGLHIGPVLSPARAILLVWLAVAVIGYKNELLASLLSLRVPLTLWALFLGSAAISTLGGNTADGPLRWGAWLIEGSIVFMLTYLTLPRVNDRRVATRVLVIATAAVAIATLATAGLGLRYESSLAVLFGQGQYGGYTPLRMGIERQQASFDTPLFFGLWVAIANTLTIPFAARSRGFRKLAWVLAMVVFAAAALSTLSRIAVAAFPALGLAYALLRKDTWRARPAARAALSLAGATIVLALGLSYLAALDRELAWSNQARLDALRATLLALVERPLFGWGFLSAKYVAAHFLGHVNYMDSLYLVLLTELGIVGFVLFLLLVGVLVFRAALMRLVLQPEDTAVLVAVGGILASGSVAPVLSSTQMIALFWILLGMLGAMRRDHTAATPSLPASG